MAGFDPPKIPEMSLPQLAQNLVPEAIALRQRGHTDVAVVIDGFLPTFGDEGNAVGTGRRQTSKSTRDSAAHNTIASHLPATTSSANLGIEAGRSALRTSLSDPELLARRGGQQRQHF